MGGRENSSKSRWRKWRKTIRLTTRATRSATPSLLCPVAILSYQRAVQGLKAWFGEYLDDWRFDLWWLANINTKHVHIESHHDCTNRINSTNKAEVIFSDVYRVTLAKQNVNFVAVLTQIELQINIQLLQFLLLSTIQKANRNKKQKNR